MKLSRTIVFKLAKSYKGNSFSIDYNSAYFHAITHGYIRRIRDILKETKLKNKELKKANGLNLAKRYKGNNFSNDHAPEYLHAAQNGYLKELQPILYRNNPIRLKGYIKHVFAIAKEYHGKYFAKDYPTEYTYALTHGYLSKLNSILYKNGAKRIKHSKERTFKLAKAFKGKSFQKKYPMECLHARNHGYLKDLLRTLGAK